MADGDKQVDPQYDLLVDDVKRTTAIAAFNDSEGGIILRESLYKDVANVLAEITAQYQTLDHIELVKKCALLSERLDFLRVLERAKPNSEIALKALKELTTA